MATAVSCYSLTVSEPYTHTHTRVREKNAPLRPIFVQTGVKKLASGSVITQIQASHMLHANIVLSLKENTLTFVFALCV